jgi:hypothetical protein
MPIWATIDKGLTDEATNFAGTYMIRRLISFFAFACLMSSCEKEEKALVLPPATGASHASVNMGNNYERQIYFDFETGLPVFTSDPDSWDLAFEAGANGRHIFMNGGRDVYVHNTHLQRMSEVTELPQGVSSGVGFRGWQYDASSWDPDSTGIGDWFGTDGITKGEVYIVRLDVGAYMKMRILAANASIYSIEWAPLESTSPNPSAASIVKDSAFNYIYFSFKNGTVQPEPAKNTWDVVFTKYRPMVYESTLKKPVPYPARGVLLNPSNTRGAADSTTAFDQITLQKALTYQQSSARDVIGYDWKQYGFSTTHYVVNRAKNYILYTRKDQIYKLHFLDFYNSAGEKGNPMFEYHRLR